MKNKELQAQEDKQKPTEIRALKRGSRYMSVNVGKVCFKDALAFSAPCSLDKYMKQWGAKLTKSIFPHGQYQFHQSTIHGIHHNPQNC